MAKQYSNNILHLLTNIHVQITISIDQMCEFQCEPLTPSPPGPPWAL
jgi:hypothetical protein